MVAQNILDLAKKVLTESHLEQAEKDVAKVSRGADMKHILHLIYIKLSSESIRSIKPMYYGWLHSLGRRQMETRDSVKYLGESVNQLVQRFPMCKKTSLGSNIPRLTSHISDDLLKILKTYDKIVRVAAEHQFIKPLDEHDFSKQDLIYITYITLVLCNKLEKYVSKV